ncbi:hypothetical protein BJ742DRAFT_836736 [Cladochytrium replicatum]|nr:hypothetical protein BJ742DRAFT_836736 [Cladochytrium replicatum]
MPLSLHSFSTSSRLKKNNTTASGPTSPLDISSHLPLSRNDTPHSYDPSASQSTLLSIREFTTKTPALEKDPEVGAWPNASNTLNTIPRREKRYCLGYLKRWQCILVWCLSITLIISAIMIPVAIKVIIPAVIKNIFATFPLDNNSDTFKNFTITQISLVNFTNDATGDGGSIFATFKGNLPKLSIPNVPSLGFSMSVDPRIYVEVLTADTNAPLIDIDLIDNSINIKQDQPLDISFDPLALRFRQPDAVRSLLQSVANAAIATITGGTPASLDTITVNIRINQTNFHILGIPITGVDLFRSVPVNLKSLLSLLKVGKNNTSAITPTRRRRLRRRASLDNDDDEELDVDNDNTGSGDRTVVPFDLRSGSAKDTGDTDDADDTEDDTVVNSDLNDLSNVHWASVTSYAKLSSSDRVSATAANLTLSILSINDLAVNVSGDEITIRVGGAFTQSLPIPLSGSIGRLSLDVHLNNETVSTLLLTGLSLKVADNSFAITTRIVPSGGFKGTGALENILKGRFDGVTVGFRNIAIANDEAGSNPVRFLNSAFSIDVTVPFSVIDMVLFALGSASSSTSGSTPTDSVPSSSGGISVGGVPLTSLFKINSASVSLAQNAAQNWVLKLTPDMTLTIPIDASISVTGFTIDVFPAATTTTLNSSDALVTLMRIGVPDIKIQGSASQPLFSGATKDISVELFSVPSARAAFGTLARSTVDSIAKAEIPTAGVAVGGVTFGSGSGPLNAFAKIVRIPFSLATLSSIVASSGGKAGSALVSGLSVGVREASLDVTGAGDGVDAGVGSDVVFSVADGLPGIVVAIPESTLRTGVDNDDLATVGLTGLALDTVTTKDNSGVVRQPLNLKTSVRFPQNVPANLPARLQQFFEILSSETASNSTSDNEPAVIIKGVDLGPNGGSKTLFSDLNIRVTPSLVSRVLSSFKTTATSNSTGSSLITSLSPVVSKLNIRTIANGGTIALDASLNNPGTILAAGLVTANTKISTNIAALTSTVQLDDRDLVTADIRLTSANRLTISGDRVNFPGVSVTGAFGRGAEIQNGVATLAESFQNGGLGGSTQRLAVTGVRIGNAGANTPISRILSTVKLALPVSSLASASGGGGGSGLDLSSIVPALKALDNGAAAFGPIAIKAASFATEDTGFALTSSIGITNPLTDVSVTIGFVRVRSIVVDGSELGGIELTNIAIDKNGAVVLTPGLKVQLQQNANVDKIVEGVLNGGAVKAEIVASGVEFGSSAADAVTAFSGARVKVALTFGGEGGSGGDLLKLVQLPSLNGAGVRQLRSVAFAVKDTGFQTSVDSTVNNPTNLAADVGFLTIQISAVNAPIAGISLTNLKLGTGQSNFAITLDGDLSSTNDASADAVASLVDAFQKGGSSNVVVSGLAFGTRANTAFKLLSNAKVSIPLNFGAASGNSTGSLLPPDVLEKLSPTQVSLTSLSKIAFAVTDAGFDTSVDTRIKNPTGLSAEIPFVTLNIDAADASRIAGISLNGLKLGTGDSSFAIALAGDLRETNQASADAVAKLFDAFQKGGASSVSVSGLTFGGSKANAFKLLSKAKVALPLNFAALSSGSGGGNNPFSGIVDQVLPSGIDSLNFRTQDDGIAATVKTTLGAKSRSNTAISFDLGFVSADVKLQNLKLGGFATENFRVASGGTAGSQLTLPFTFTMAQADTAALADPIATIANPLVDRVVAKLGLGTGAAPGNVPDVKVAIRNVGFGTAKAKVFNLLSGVEVGLTLPSADLVKIADGVAGGASGGAGAKIDLASLLQSAVVNTVQTGFNIDVRAQVPPQIALTNNVIANLGFFSVSTASGPANLVDLNLNPIILNFGKLSTTAGINFGSSGEAQDEVAKIADVVLNKAQTTLNTISVTNVKFGTPNGQNLLLSKVKVNVDSRKLISNVLPSGGGAPANGGGSIRNVLVPDPLNTLSVKLGLTAKGASGTFSTSLSQKFPDIKVNLPFGALDGFAGDSLAAPSFLTGSLNNVAISKAVSATPATIDATLSSTQGDFYVTLAKGVVESKPVTLTLGNLRFGASANNPITLFSKIPVKINIDGSSGIVALQGAPAINILPNINVVVRPESKLPVDLTITNGLTANVRFGKANGERDIATVQVHGENSNAPLRLNEGNNAVKLDIGGIRLGGVILGGISSIFGGSASVELANINLQGVDWLNQALSGKDIAVDLGKVLGG